MELNQILLLILIVKSFSKDKISLLQCFNNKNFNRTSNTEIR